LGFGALGNAEIEAAPAESFGRAGEAAHTRRYRAAGWTGSARRADGYFSFATRQKLPPLTAETTSSIPSEAQAVARAKDLAAQLGLLNEEVASVDSHGIAVEGRTLLGRVEPVTIGRMVELKRAVGGYRVLGSSVRFEFGKDMQLQRTLIHWPHFRMRPTLSRMRDRTVVLGEVDQKAAGKALRKMEIVYAQGDDGFMAPALLVVTGVPEAGAPGVDNRVRGMPQQHVILLAE